MSDPILDVDGEEMAGKLAVVTADLHTFEDEKNPHPWERQPGESKMWYSRFLLYRNLGPGRSLRKAVAEYQRVVLGRPPEKITGQPSQTWLMCADRWKWKERAFDWDIWIAEEHQTEFEQRRIKDRERRLSLIETGRNILTEFLVTLDPETTRVARIGDLFDAIETLNSEMRRELGDEDRFKKQPEQNNVTITFSDILKMANSAQSADPLPETRVQEIPAKTGDQETVDGEFEEIGDDGGESYAPEWEEDE